MFQNAVLFFGLDFTKLPLTKENKTTQSSCNTQKTVAIELYDPSYDRIIIVRLKLL